MITPPSVWQLIYERRMLLVWRLFLIAGSATLLYFARQSTWPLTWQVLALGLSFVVLLANLYYLVMFARAIYVNLKNQETLLADGGHNDSFSTHHNTTPTFRNTHLDLDQEKVELHKPTTYAPTTPLPECDVVMKGGVTSGVVYPLAICKIASHYQLKNIGGSSAGAIAAVAAAAAEYRRAIGGVNAGTGYTKISYLPEFLMGQKPTSGPEDAPPLSQLFQSNHWALGFAFEAFKFFQKLPLKVIFGPLLILLVAAGVWYAVHLGVDALMRNQLPGYQVRGSTEALLAHILVTTFAFMILVGTTLSGLMIHLQNNNFGICKGAGKPKALMNWMHSYVQNIVELQTDQPLTFGDLKKAGVTLKLNTTCITTGQAVVFHDGLMQDHPLDKVLAFRPHELKGYLPDDIIEAMKTAGQPVPRHPDLFHLPEGDQLPVLFATRISLSFPVLFSVVPLYIRDPYAARPQWTRCWFSDGGITSNMPLHFFDTPLPTRPTFAITLNGYRDDHPDLDKDTIPGWLKGMVTRRSGKASVQRPDEATLNWRSVFVTLQAPHSFAWWTKATDLFSALSAMWNAAQNAEDEGLMAYPGYRDRMAFVCLSSDEGGLNLNMKPKAIKSLAMRGLVAGCKLVDKFLTSSEAQQNWTTHVQERTMHFFAGHHKMMQKFNTNFQKYDEQQVKVNQTVINSADILNPLHMQQQAMQEHERYVQRCCSQCWESRWTGGTNPVRCCA